MTKVTFANSIDITKIFNEYQGGKIDKGNVCCPFHDDTNASMKLYKKNNKFKCFGCGFYGGPIDFVLNKKYNGDKGRFLDVVDELCSSHGYIPDEAEKVDNPNKVRDMEAYQKKVQYTNDIKKASDAAHACLPRKHNYFTKRGIPTEIQNQYELGFMSPDLEGKESYDYINIITAGIMSADKTMCYTNRWIIPIKDAYGNHIGWAGRTLEKDQPKYINSPDSEYFHKGKILWNYNIAKSYDTIYVVEGFMDALSLITAGIPNVVALMGCQMTEEQYQLLRRKEIILALDNDVAGDRATCKIIMEHPDKQFSVLNISNRKEKDLNDILLSDGKKEIVKIAKENLCPGVEWCLKRSAFYNDLTNVDNQEKLWKTLSKLIGAREEAYQNAYPLNLNYSPIMFNKFWELFDNLIKK